MPNKTKSYWFPAKRYGWGWGFLSAWQGWVVLVVFIAVVAILPMLVGPNENLPGFLISITASAAILTGICYVKGEPPKWRWGNVEDKKESEQTGDGE